MAKSDNYPTKPEDAERALRALSIDTPKSILDPGAGTGVWGREARKLWPDAYIAGVEIQPHCSTAPPDGYDAWFSMDYLSLTPKRKPDLIIGNPPFSIAEKFIHHSLDLLEPEGYLYFLLRLAFLEGQGRYKTLWSTYGSPHELKVFKKRPSFKDNGKTDFAAYAMFKWCKDENGVYNIPTDISWI